MRNATHELVGASLALAAAQALDARPLESAGLAAAALWGSRLPDLDQLGSRVHRRSLLERRNVGLARARNHLVIPCIPRPNKRGGLLSELAKHLPELDDDTRGRDVGGVHVLDPETLPPLVAIERQRTEELTEEQIDAGVAELEAWVAARAAVLRAARAGLNVVTASSVKPIDRILPLATTTDAGDAAISLDLAPPVDIATAVPRDGTHHAAFR